MTLLLLLACTEPTPSAPQRPPPGVTLDATAIASGEEAVFEVYNAPPGATVEVVGSRYGTGFPLCLPPLGGACLDLFPPLFTVGRMEADAGGHARLALRVPWNAPAGPVAFQAVVRSSTPADLSAPLLRDLSRGPALRAETVWDDLFSDGWTLETWACASGAPPTWDEEAAWPGATLQYALSADLGCAGGYSGIGFDRRTPDYSWVGWMYPNQRLGARFRFHHGATAADDGSLEVTLDLDQRRPLADYLGPPDGQGWREAVVPFADLNADVEPFHRFMLFNASPTGDPAFLVDTFEVISVDDLEPPLFGRLRVADLAPDGATLHVPTDEHTRVVVEVRGGGVQLTTPPTDWSRRHEVVLTGLPSSTTFDVTVRAEDHQEAGPAFRSVAHTTLTTLAPDLTPPALAGFTVSGVGATVATLCWTSDEPADHVVRWGASSRAIGGRPTAPCTVLTGLSPSTSYTWSVTATDRWGNSATTPSGQPFTTTAMPIVTGSVQRLGAATPFPDELRGVALGTWNWFWGRPYPGDSPRLRELTRLMAPGVIRASGGNWANDVTWDPLDSQCYPRDLYSGCQRRTFPVRQDGVDTCGPTPVTVPGAYRLAVQADELSDIATFADDVGADVMIQVNAATCDPGQWADLVAWSRIDHDYPFKYWEIGNEFDLNYHLDGRDVPTGAAYAERYVAYYDALTAVDPTIEVVGPAASQHEEDPLFLAMSDLILPLLDDPAVQADRLDWLSWHLYPWYNGVTPVTADDLLSWGSPADLRTRAHLDDCAWEKRLWLDARGMESTRVAITELAGVVVGEPTILNVNHAGALWFADALPRLAANGVDMAILWELYDDPLDTSFGLITHDGSEAWYDPSAGLDVIDDRFRPLPAWYTYAMLANLFGTELLPATTSRTDVPIWASRDPAHPEDLWLLVVNLTGDSVNANISLGGWIPQLGARQWTLANPAYTEALDKESVLEGSTINGRAVDPTTAASIVQSWADIEATPVTYPISAGGVLRTFGPHTVTAIQLDDR